MSTSQELNDNCAELFSMKVKISHYINVKSEDEECHSRSWLLGIKKLF